MVLQGIESAEEGCNVDSPLAHADVPSSDTHSGVVDALGQAELEHLGLQAALQKVLNLKAKHVIQLHPSLVEHSDADEASEQSVALKETLGVALLQGEQLSGGLADLGQRKLDPPDLPLVSQAVLADELELLVEAGLLVGPPRGGVHLGVDGGDAVVHHGGGGGQPKSQTCDRMDRSNNYTTCVLEF